MKKILIVLLLITALFVPVFAGVLNNAGKPGFAGQDSPRGNFKAEGVMAYCTQNDLEAAYGEDRIAAWSRMDLSTIERAVKNAGAEIDGF
ncbi:MAG: DUF1320 domain-containing protein [Treponema sp.]|jgi:hypothetical protein|nr:DUF1320 domain-containing protein [Treponema sp.]